MQYVDFVDLSYKPLPSDVVCTFHVEPAGVSLEEAAGAVAAESSVGTWTELTTMKPYMERLAAKVFEIRDSTVRIAYPLELFEEGNLPNVLSSVAGNVFGLKALENLRLIDLEPSEAMLKSYVGPRYGVEGVRALLKVAERPLVGTIIKPKLGLNTEDHAEVAYEAWRGGCDIVKDDENLSGQKFNVFEKRVVKTLERRDKAQSETGERKVYMVNITADAETMVRRAEFIHDHGGEYVMVDVLTCGFAALQSLRNRGLELVIHGHRAGHAAFTKNPQHGISMRVIAKFARMAGVDQLHVGTIVGKMSESEREVLENAEALRMKMGGLKRTLPVASGGIHPRLVPFLIKKLGTDLVIQAGGGVHGHKDGSAAGATAMRQAVDAVMNGLALEEYAETHRELKTALETWRM